MKKNDKAIQILGLEVFSRPKSELLKILEEKLLGSFPLQTIATPNLEQLVQADQNPSFQKTLQQFEFLIPDGIGVLLASRVLSQRNSNRSASAIAERIPGVDLVSDLLQIAKRHEHRVLVLGGRDYLASEKEEAAREQASVPAEIQSKVWWTPGYNDVLHPTETEEKAVSDAVKEIRPTIVFVAFGAPAQEFWIHSHRELLAGAGVRLAMAVGGSFDYLLGKVPRAPRFFQQAGLEWAYRLWQEPWRWRRQLRVFPFLKIVAVKWMAQRQSET